MLSECISGIRPYEKEEKNIHGIVHYSYYFCNYLQESASWEIFDDLVLALAFWQRNNELKLVRLPRMRRNHISKSSSIWKLQLNRYDTRKWQRITVEFEQFSECVRGHHTIDNSDNAFSNRRLCFLFFKFQAGFSRTLLNFRVSAVVKSARWTKLDTRRSDKIKSTLQVPYIRACMKRKGICFVSVRRHLLWATPSTSDHMISMYRMIHVCDSKIIRSLRAFGSQIMSLHKSPKPKTKPSIPLTTGFNSWPKTIFKARLWNL